MGDRKPKTSERLRLLCSGMASKQRPLSEDSKQEFLFLKDHLLEVDWDNTTSVLNQEDINLDISTVRSSLSDAYLKQAKVVNSRNGFYLQFGGMDLPAKFDVEFPDEKYIYR